MHCSIGSSYSRDNGFVLSVEKQHPFRGVDLTALLYVFNGIIIKVLIDSINLISNVSQIAPPLHLFTIGNRVCYLHKILMVDWKNAIRRIS
jgi:hypothetical protein